MARARRRMGGGVRQRVSWARSVPAAATNIPAASSVLLLSLSTGAFAEESTIRRTIVDMYISSDQVAGTEFQIGAVGMHIANDAAIAAGVASLLAPVTDSDDEAWYLWAPIGQSTRVATAVGFDGVFGFRYVVDSKAQRRLQSGQSAALIIQNTHATNAFDATVSISTLVGFGLKRL